jgi:hypothetical protein
MCQYLFCRYFYCGHWETRLVFCCEEARRLMYCEQVTLVREVPVYGFCGILGCPFATEPPYYRYLFMMPGCPHMVIMPGSTTPEPL